MKFKKIYALLLSTAIATTSCVHASNLSGTTDYSQWGNLVLISGSDIMAREYDGRYYAAIQCVDDIFNILQFIAVTEGEYCTLSNAYIFMLLAFNIPFGGKQFDPARGTDEWWKKVVEKHKEREFLDLLRILVLICRDEHLAKLGRSVDAVKAGYAGYTKDDVVECLAKCICHLFQCASTAVENVSRYLNNKLSTFTLCLRWTSTVEDENLDDSVLEDILAALLTGYSANGANKRLGIMNTNPNDDDDDDDESSEIGFNRSDMFTPKSSSDDDDDDDESSETGFNRSDRFTPKSSPMIVPNITPMATHQQAMAQQFQPQFAGSNNFGFPSNSSMFAAPNSFTLPNVMTILNQPYVVTDNSDTLSRMRQNKPLVEALVNNIKINPHSIFYMYVNRMIVFNQCNEGISTNSVTTVRATLQDVINDYLILRAQICSLRLTQDQVEANRDMISRLLCIAKFMYAFFAGDGLIFPINTYPR